MEWYGIERNLNDRLDDLGCEEPTERGLFAIAIAINSLAYQLRELGKGDACSPQGAIEHLAGSIEKISDSLDSIATSIDSK